MGTVALEQGNEGRRSVDCEVNLIPMVDLLVCSISFLLITAVWSHMSRIEGSASAGGHGPLDEPEKVLHVDMRGDKSFLLSWKVGPTVLASSEVPRKGVEMVGQDSVRFPDLADQIAREWLTHAVHRNPGDRTQDRAVVHTSNATPFDEVVAVLDAVARQRRPLGAAETPVSVFRVGFATD